MRYTVNYNGAFLTGDSDGWNVFETNSWNEAKELFYTLYYANFLDAYIRDEEYHCIFHFDLYENDFIWEA
jgi:hypothetical protein